MFIEIPFIYRLAFGLVMLSITAFGGYKVIKTVGHYSGATQPYIGDPQTGCAYPQLYVDKKNEKEAGQFIPITRQAKFNGREEALKAGFRQCQN